MSLKRLVGDEEIEAAIVGEVLLAREFEVQALDRIIAALLDRNGHRPVGQSCKVLFDGLDAQPFYMAGSLSCVQKLEDAWVDLRAELSDACHSTAFHPYRQAGADFIDRDHWSTLNLFFADGRTAPHAGLCPKTVSMLGAHEDLCEVAMLSRLAGGGRIRPHCGPWNARLIIHVGITVPNHCGIRVGGEVRQWSEGRALVFDDSLEHECWNDDTEDRYVLLFAAWHPGWKAHELRLLKNIERLLGRTYWQHPDAEGLLRRFEAFLGIANEYGQHALWPQGVPIPHGWKPTPPAS